MNTPDIEQISFSFGRNWQSYVTGVDEIAIASAYRDIEEWLGPDYVKGKSVLDLGCGSGLHSYCFYQAGVGRLVSVDIDPASVEATRVMRKQAGDPDAWQLLQGSALTNSFLESLGTFDIVYSWGVLHHTGKMWQAIDNALNRCNDNSLFFVSLYVKGELYPNHLALKRRYNAANKLGKRWMEGIEIARLMMKRLKVGQNPFKWNQRKERGMNVYHDLVDWLGGLPYEVTSKEEIVAFCKKRGFTLQRSSSLPEGSCNIYVFTRHT